MTEREHIHSVHRIVLCTLDSLYSGVALHELIKAFPERVVLIVASKRYGGKYGSFWKQLTRNWKRGGFAFVTYLSFHFVYHYVFLFLSDTFNLFLRRPKKVYTVRQLAKRFNIPLIYTTNPNLVDTFVRIEATKPDLIVSAYFDHVIRQNLINLPTFGVINVHTSLLPDFRGPFPALWPLIHNQERIGVSVHYINSEELDAGPIILQKECGRRRGESVLGTDCRLFRQGIELVKRAIIMIEEGTVCAIAHEQQGRYFSFPRRADLALLRRHGIPLVRWRDVISQYL